MTEKSTGRFPYYLFEQIQRDNPYWSSWVCFCQTLKKANVSKRVLRKAFFILVDKDDYDKNELNELLNYLTEGSLKSSGIPL